MLTFVGLGLFDAEDITLKGLRAVREADAVYIEMYTSTLAGATIKDLEDLYQRDIIPLMREDIEEKPFFLDEAINKNIVLLSGGDPMVSTTHVDLRLRAKRMNIPTRIVHAPSISSAVCGLTGLQNYRFGRSATIPFPYVLGEKRIVYDTPYHVILENLKNGLHTLLYLDIAKKMMCASEGVSLLLEVAESHSDYAFREMLGVVVGQAGSPEPLVRAMYLKKIVKLDSEKTPQVVIVPAKLHFMEAEALVEFASAPKRILNNST
ncbi:MAG: diphthine synthase [Methermicoccaceae archaeon]